MEEEIMLPLQSLNSSVNLLDSFTLCQAVTALSFTALVVFTSL